MPGGLVFGNATYFMRSFSAGHNTSFLLISCPLLLSWLLLFHAVRYDSDEAEEIYLKKI